MSRIGRTKFVVLVEGESEPFIRCINLCQAPCLVLKTRRVKVRRDSSAGSSPVFQRRFLQLVPSPDWTPFGRKIQKHVRDSLADEEVAVDRQEEQRATAVKRKRTESRNTLLSSSGMEKYITLVIATGSSESRNVNDCKRKKCKRNENQSLSSHPSGHFEVRCPMPLARLLFTISPNGELARSLLLWLTFNSVFPSRFQKWVILAWYIPGGRGGVLPKISNRCGPPRAL